MRCVNDEARQWAGIISVMQEKGLISIATVMACSEDVQRKYRLTWNEMSSILNEVHEEIDFEASEAFVDVVWK